MNNKKLRILALIVSVMMLLAGCSTGGTGEGTPEQAQGNGKVMILYTSDMHCGVREGFGLAGLQAIRENLESEGYETLLVDDGDGFTMFDDKKSAVMTGRLDSEDLINYIKEDLGGEVGTDYADPYGQGRISIIQ